MKTGLTIQQMAQELLRQSKAKQDYLVNTGSLSLSVASDVPQLRVTEEGTDKIAPLDIRQTAHRQLGTYLGIPQKYYELMRADAPELLAYNANYWFSQKNELRTLRTIDGCARAFLSNRYRRIDNLDMTGRNIRQAQILIEVVVMSKITEKIAKLLALAESPYEEEAKAALLQARRLMAEHKLMPEDIEPQENKKVVQECVGVTCTKLSSPWTVYLSTLIAAHYCCRPYRSSVHGSKVSEIGFIGMEDDFKLCKLAFLYAYDCIASRCRQIRTQKGYPAKTLREMCNSYGWGFCRGLSAAFQKQEAEHQEWGLVMVVPQAVEDAVSKMKRSSYKISPQSSMNHQYAAMGYADGQEFDMRRRLEPSA